MLADALASNDKSIKEWASPIQEICPRLDRLLTLCILVLKGARRSERAGPAQACERGAWDHENASNRSLRRTETREW